MPPTPQLPTAALQAVGRGRNSTSPPSRPSEEEDSGDERTFAGTKGSKSKLPLPAHRVYHTSVISLLHPHGGVSHTQIIWTPDAAKALSVRQRTAWEDASGNGGTRGRACCAPRS